MILSKQWFLFIEGSLMLVIFWTWIFSAALFPSMTAYLKRSRDAARISGVKDISTAIGAYYTDHEKYPDADPSGCVPRVLDSMYLPKGIPTDPRKGRLSDGCDGSQGMTYAYRSFTGTGGVSTFAIAVTLENIYWGNSAEPLSYLTKYEELVHLQDTLTRWSGPYYIITN